MSKIKKQIDTKLVKSVNKNVRSSTRKLNPILKSIVGKKVDIAIRDLTFSDKRISKDIFSCNWPFKKKWPYRKTY